MRQLMVIQNRGFCNGNLRAEWNVSLCWIVTLQVAAWKRLGIHVEDVALGVGGHEFVHGACANEERIEIGSE